MDNIKFILLMIAFVLGLFLIVALAFVGFRTIEVVLYNKDCTIRQENEKDILIKQYNLETISSGDTTTIQLYRGFMGLPDKAITGQNIKIVCQ